MGTYLRVEEYEGFGWCVLISGGLLFVAMLLRDGKALWLLAVVKALSTKSGGAKLLVSNSKSGATSAKGSLAPEML
ncbi:hypothetical protein Tco_0080063 [Tanacetum coccineum]